MKEYLCRSQNGVEVFFDSSNSHTATHFEDTPALRPAVIEALAATDLGGDHMIFECNLGRIIGTTDLVETDDRDEIIYAKRKNRDIYTRFTKSQRPRECSTVTMFVERHDDKKYNLGSAWIGYIGPSFPGSEHETPESRPYWARHALVWGRQEIQPNTETSDCPW